MSGSREQQTGRSGNLELLFGGCQCARLWVDGQDLQVVGVLPGDDQKRPAGSDNKMPRRFNCRSRLSDFFERTGFLVDAEGGDRVVSTIRGIEKFPVCMHLNFRCRVWLIVSCGKSC